jgi:hypothetical protein
MLRVNRLCMQSRVVERPMEAELGTEMVSTIKINQHSTGVVVEATVAQVCRLSKAWWAIPARCSTLGDRGQEGLGSCGCAALDPVNGCSASGSWSSVRE